MHPPDPNWHEYPKWVGGVVVASVAEERAVRAAAAELADTEAVEAERKAGQLLAEREKAKGGRPTETPRPGGAVLPLAERHQAKAP